MSSASNPGTPTPPVSPTPTPDSHTSETKPRRGIGAALSAFFAMIKWFVLLPMTPFRGAARDGSNQVTVYSAHPSFYLWLPIFIGFIGSWWVRWQPAAEHFFGWLYIWVLMFFIVTLLYDFSIRKLGVWLGIFTLIWLTSKWFEDVKEWVLLGHVFGYLASLEPKLDPGMATVLSWLLLLPWFGSLIFMSLNGRKTFSPNEISEQSFGEGKELTDRSGLRFRTKYKDLLETLLTFGGGELQAVDNHQNVIKHWDNIVGLYFLWADLDTILHERSVVDSKKPGDATASGS
jgi:hypothetical protein